MTLLPYFIALKFSLSESTTSPKNRDIYHIFSVLGETKSLRAQLALTGFIPLNHEVYFQEKDERTLSFFLSFCQKIDKVNDATTLWVYSFQKSYENDTRFSKTLSDVLSISLEKHNLIFKLMDEQQFFSFKEEIISSKNLKRATPSYLSSLKGNVL